MARKTSSRTVPQAGTDAPAQGPAARQAQPATNGAFRPGQVSARPEGAAKPRSQAKPKPPAAPRPEQLMTLDEAAALLRLSRHGVRNLLFGTARNPPLMRHLKFGKSIRVYAADVADFLAAHTRLGADN